MNGETPIFTINKSLIYYLSNSYVFMGLKTAQNRNFSKVFPQIRSKHLKTQGNHLKEQVFFLVPCQCY
jgi:uncharacterized protein YtpQ (UPF0354 family)